MLKMWEKSPWGEEVIAQLVERDQIQGFLKQAVIGPGEAAVLIRNGKIEDVLTQDKLKKLSGGIVNWFANKLGGGEAFQLLFVSTVPIDLELPIDGILSQDHEEVNGTCTIRIQITQNNATKVINLMKGSEELTQTKKGLFRTKEVSVGRFLLKGELEGRLKKEALAMVLSTHISKVDAKDFRGNLDLIKEMETAAEVEMRKTFEMWGLNLLKLYTVWERGAYDELMRFKREREQLFEKSEFEVDLEMQSQLGQLNRTYEINRTKLEHDWALSLKGVGAEEKVEDIRHESELRRQQRAFDEDDRQVKQAGMTQVDLKRADMQVDVDKDKADSDIAMDAFAKVQEAKRQRMALEQQHQQDQMRMQTDSTERIMSQAVQAGIADPDSLKEMMKQQTMQKGLDREGEKVKALSEAEKARYDRDTYMQAEDRERQHRVDMTGEATKMMEASKQNVPQVVGGGYAPPAQPAVNVITVDQSKQQEDPATKSKCPECSTDIQHGWKVCPVCKNSLEE